MRTEFEYGQRELPNFHFDDAETMDPGEIRVAEFMVADGRYVAAVVMSKVNGMATLMPLGLIHVPTPAEDYPGSEPSMPLFDEYDEED